MNLLFQSTEDFEQDLQQVDTPTRQRIVHSLNQVARAFVEDKKTFARHARKPYRVKLGDGYDSSLYAVRVDSDLHAILTVDDDPLFDQVIITLIRVVNRADLKETYGLVAKALYQDFNGSKAKQGVRIG
jgi:hypothetical protein